MSAPVIASRYVAEYAALAPNLPGQGLSWLADFRRNAFAQFALLGFPSIRQEEWRYTNVSGIEKQFFQVKSATTLTADVVADQQLADTWSVVLIDGHFAAQHSLLADLPAGLVICSMADALVQHSELVAANLGQAVSDTENSFVAFNAAWFNDGVFVYVPAGQILAKPLQLLNIVTQADALVTPRNLVIVDKQAEATLIESYVAVNQPEQHLAYLTTAVTEVMLGQNAQLSHYKLQAESAKAYHFSGTYVQQARDARFMQHNFQFGSLIARNEIHTELQQAAECSLNGLYSGINRQHIDNHTRIIHAAPNASSREMYKGILDDRARGVFQGRVIVAEQAQKTDSQMNNRNLLLSADAEVDTKPQLEIYADDVKCAHGMTVGQLEEKSVFYLQSRGVDVETARNMLTFAFANEMVDKIAVRSLHDQVLELLLSRFPQEGIEKDWL